jgi:hypothetical protein
MMEEMAMDALNERQKEIGREVRGRVEDGVKVCGKCFELL